MERFIFGAEDGSRSNLPQDEEVAEHESRTDDERNHEEQSNDKLHSEDLFDQDEDHAGERLDLVTGKSIDNSTYTGLEDLSIVDETADEEELTSGERWLRENDPTHPKYIGKK